MSRRANPLDNAPMESFFHTLKTAVLCSNRHLCCIWDEAFPAYPPGH